MRISSLILFGLVGLTSHAPAQTPRSLNLSAANVDGRTGSEVPHYVIEFELPVGITTARQAWLEMRMDVSSRATEGPVDPAPMLEIYVLKNDISAAPTASDFDTTRLPMSRPVALGASRLVRIEIGEFIRKIIADPNSNHGLVLGALTGARSGEFAIDGDGFGPGVPARITIFE